MRYTEDEENYDDEWYADELRPQQALTTRTNPYANRSGVRFGDRIYDDERRSHQLAPRVSRSASSRTHPQAYGPGSRNDERNYDDEWYADERRLQQALQVSRRTSAHTYPNAYRSGSHNDESEVEMVNHRMGSMGLDEYRRPLSGWHRGDEDRSRQHGDRSRRHDGRELREFGPLVQSRESGIRGIQHHHTRGPYASSGCVLHPFGGASGQARCACPCHGCDADDDWDEEVTLSFTSRRRYF
jgi:hypothetical protein